MLRLLLLCALFFLSTSWALGQSVVLHPDRVFDGEAMHDGWVVVVDGEDIVSAGPEADVFH